MSEPELRRHPAARRVVYSDVLADGKYFFKVIAPDRLRRRGRCHVAPGEHVVVARAIDANNNVGLAKVVVR